MNKETFQRYALVTIVVLLAAIASQQVMAFTKSAMHHDHDVVIRHVDVEFLADERRVLADERRILADEERMLAEEARALAHEAHRMAQEGIHMHDGVCELSEEVRDFAREARHIRDQIRVEVR